MSPSRKPRHSDRIDSEVMADVALVLQGCVAEMDRAVQLLADRSDTANLLQAFALLRNSSVQMRAVVASLKRAGYPQR